VTSRPAAWPVASTRLVALLGWPTEHSRSPAMHNAAFAHDGLDLIYLAIPTPVDRLGDVVGALGAIGAVGANVTIPHKQAVMASCDHVTDEAGLVGAVNTLTWDDGRLIGDNTDAAGLQRDLHEVLGAGRRERAVVLGTGGAARAVAAAAARMGWELVVVGRHLDRADEVADVARSAGGAATALQVDDDTVAVAVASADVVVNATPLGMHGESLPGAFMTLTPDQVAYDLVYSPGRTPFLQAAGSAGVAAHNGLGMLVQQAAAAYEIWTGRQAPVSVMQAAAAPTP